MTADEPAIRAYRSERLRLSADVARACAAVRRHLDDADEGGLGLRVDAFGADAADLVAKVSALKALRDVEYLVDGA